jgi:hypothetical protein
MANQLPQVKDTGITGKCRRLCTGVFKVKADKVEGASNSLILKYKRTETRDGSSHNVLHRFPAPSGSNSTSSSLIGTDARRAVILRR